VIRSETPVYDKKSTGSSILAYLDRDDIVYVSERLTVDADNAQNDWLFCHFDSERGIINGYLRMSSLVFLAEEETQDFLQAMDNAGEYTIYENNPLLRIDCTFPDELAITPLEKTTEPENTPTPEPNGTESQLQDGSITPPVADLFETPPPEPSPDPETESTGTVPEQTEMPTGEPAFESAFTVMPVASITLDAVEIVMMAGTQHIINALVEPAEATDPSLLWSSSDESVLTVDAAGNVTAVSTGSAVITAAAADSSGIYAQCTVSVYPLISSLSVTGQKRIQVGKTYPLTLLDQEVPVAGSLLTWSSSDATVASVDASGAVTGVSVGSTVITVAVQGSPELTFDFPVEIIHATIVTITDSNKQFSKAVSQNNSSSKESGFKARINSEFRLMRLLLRTDGTVPAVDDYNPDMIIGNKDNRYMIQFTSVEETEAAYNALKDAGYIKYVVPDSIMSISKNSKTQSYYSYHSWGAEAMHADTANEGIATMTGGVVYVAVIDTGIADHSFLSGKHWVYYDYVDYDDDPSDENGHGTHVAGTIVDLTQALDVRVVAFRALDEYGEGYVSDITDAIFDAADAGCDVINIPGVGYRCDTGVHAGPD
jgi:hypothetical protein